ncbi:transporter substrate-binding domain-containing protein [Streptomyces iconiensis]|uniref:Transporter substrate-binding domain-containing protein n=1 Tax=Streptomyces iconiensis TaxID=1384038 RepID=A0ABT6ZZC2_9ACTN|nr:transporter substrate-binding domain-containing protein [Streptomyces iconiensis]MDJ1134422.1 transporter substrate-binding domain-containing protein [Streptomyces iconiensis]
MSSPRRPVHRRHLWGSCLLALSLLLTACGLTDKADGKPSPGPTSGASTPGPPSLAEKKNLLVGLKKGQPGFSTKHGDVFEGFEADLTEELAEKVGFVPDYRDIPSLRREEILKNQTADLIVATYSVTGPRDEQVDFTAPYIKTYQGLLVRDDNTGIKELNDVDGKRVCTARGSTSDPESVRKKEQQEAIKKALGPNVKPGFRKDYKECVLEMRDDGNFDAVWTDKILLKGYERDYKGIHVVDNITVESPQFYAVGLRQGDEKFCRRLNKALKEFVFSADWRAYFKSHFDKVYKEDKSGFQAKYRPTRDEFDEMAKDSCGAAD